MVARLQEMGFVPGRQISINEKEVQGETGNVGSSGKKSFWSFWS